MDCFRVQDLVSPYLDQQLTGAEMLEIQRHLMGCRPCAEEYLAAREVKTLLGSLRLPPSESSLETRILSRVAQEERRGESFLPLSTTLSALPALWQTAPTLAISLLPPSRGRRLTAAFALSCFAVLAVAAPFAPSTPVGPGGMDRAALGQAAMLDPIPNAGLRPVAAYGGPWVRPVAVGSVDLTAGMMVPGDQGSAPAGGGVPLTGGDAEPLGDAAASGYVSGDVALVSYHVR